MSKKAFGDWQTPAELARAVLARLDIDAPRCVLEPTCGDGAFLAAASERFPGAMLVGYELDPTHADRARAGLRGTSARIETADFFAVDWREVLSGLPRPLLVAGNPPWVTSAALGALGASNSPAKTNFKRLSGLDARTGKSNFDVSEWMLLRIIDALGDAPATIAVLCKTAVARRVIELSANHALPVRPGALFRIDAQRYFDASVDAVLFVCDVGGAEDGPPSRTVPSIWPVHPSLEALGPDSTMVVVDGALVADANRIARTAHLVGASSVAWRSGLKHDCARVMELAWTAEGWKNGHGEVVAIEDALVYPLLKSSDVANGGARKRRGVIVPQRSLGDDTRRLSRDAPAAWAYLQRHRELLEARKSSIYRGQPPFAVFGVGPYSFARWKVAISGLYKRLAFALLGPEDGRPVIVDDTCYFLPFDEEAAARAAFEALVSPLARDFFEARIFWDAKRPINKAILQQLDLAALRTAIADDR